MNLDTQSPPPRGPAPLPGRKRVLVALGIASLLGTLLLPVWRSGALDLYLRVWVAALAALMAFGLFERWPSRLPRWLARWALQVLGVAVSVPMVLFAIWVLSTNSGAPWFWNDWERLAGFLLLGLTGVLLAPWVALSALVRQKEAFAHDQALAFALERSELERRALDARLRLLQAQVEPHFLFNTLANVRALVDAGSPQAPRVLDSLIAYLRAAVPRLQQAATTLDEELHLVQAYLQLMHMRIPDRLQFGIDVDPGTLAIACPPMTLLTLVENAVRHGIDPSEEGGRIDIAVRLQSGRCLLRVSDTGVGFQHADDGLGTGLASLRERLQLSFDGQAQLRVTELAPHGVCAEVEFPARQGGA